MHPYAIAGVDISYALKPQCLHFDEIFGRFQNENFLAVTDEKSIKMAVFSFQCKDVILPHPYDITTNVISYGRLIISSEWHKVKAISKGRLKKFIHITRQLSSTISYGCDECMNGVINAWMVWWMHELCDKCMNGVMNAWMVWWMQGFKGFIDR